jgi:pyruvate/2-oxoglutarate/acetoin dehydrogenase E1 component/TPP-dependent pyruvate/acetoin dehydrogenase alpha subunit
LTACLKKFTFAIVHQTFGMTKEPHLLESTYNKKGQAEWLPSKEKILQDFEWCCLSREASLIARREVLTGKAKFGITGDGKELAQVAIAHFLQNGDFRSGYYRDQTLMFATGVSTVSQYFSQLYADPVNDPFSGGRQMNAHFATPLVNKNGDWLDHMQQFNISSDISSTGGQMARALGLALASKKYREKPDFDFNKFSKEGREICLCTIGDASTSEGIFWETVNAAGVLQVPLVIAVWDDGYGISVPKSYQTVQSSISQAVSGMEKTQKDGNGIRIFKAKAWDYIGLLKAFSEGISLAREEHIPVLFHIDEATQPQGHSTSGSHERYKSKERIEWEKKFDCIRQFEDWIIKNEIASLEDTQKIKAKATKSAKTSRDQAWKLAQGPLQIKLQELKSIYTRISHDINGTRELAVELNQFNPPQLGEMTRNARRMFFLLRNMDIPEKTDLDRWIHHTYQIAEKAYHENLICKGKKGSIHTPVIPPDFEDNAPMLNGYQLLNKFFDYLFEHYPNLYAFGEDLGFIGDVNQGFAGLQGKYGEERIFDTGIREQTIVGQAIGMAMRGLRPIAEIQYLDYLIYALQPLTDDLATIRWRSNGIQQAPVIIRSRGHRLEGIWHSGSPMGMILNSLRGMHVCVPRNMTQAAGMYSTLLQGNDPALVIECLNGYRLKEKLPSNLGVYTVPLGSPEILKKGQDVTLVTYGSCVRIAQEAITLLEQINISVELIDIQTLLPFDLEKTIVDSIKKTNRVVFLDEDVPGGATAFMLKEVLETQGGYEFLDAAPVTITSKAHRPPYGSDGDYFSKPNVEDVYERIYEMMSESNFEKFPL